MTDLEKLLADKNIDVALFVEAVLLALCLKDKKDNE